MNIPRALCCECAVEMTTRRMGVRVEMLMADGNPYYQIKADCLECPSCGIRIVTGFAKQPLAEHYQEGYMRESPENQYHFAGDLNEVVR